MQGSRRHRYGAAALALAVLAGAAACGGGAEESAAPEAAAADSAPAPALSDPGPVHVHGLGYHRPTRTLYIATHTGLFELPDGAAKATRIGDSHQDTMGFVLTPDGRFLGSGHPDARENRPPHLGLVESKDAGRSWRTVSLEGEADFHVLRARGRYVYGLDGANARFLASADGGETWAERPLPESLVDLVVDPSQPRHLLAAGASSLYESTDGGERWTPVAAGVSGLLAWPAPRKLYAATLDGAFLTAAAPGGPWRSLAPPGGPVAALHAGGQAELFAALHDGTILHSGDGGRSWAVRSTP